MMFFVVARFAEPAHIEPVLLVIALVVMSLRFRITTCLARLSLNQFGIDMCAQIFIRQKPLRVFLNATDARFPSADLSLLGLEIAALGALRCFATSRGRLIPFAPHSLPCFAFLGFVVGASLRSFAGNASLGIPTSIVSVVEFCERFSYRAH